MLFLVCHRIIELIKKNVCVWKFRCVAVVFLMILKLLPRTWIWTDIFDQVITKESMWMEYHSYNLILTTRYVRVLFDILISNDFTGAVRYSNFEFFTDSPRKVDQPTHLHNLQPWSYLQHFSQCHFYVCTVHTDMYLYNVSNMIMFN